MAQDTPPADTPPAQEDLAPPAVEPPAQEEAPPAADQPTDQPGADQPAAPAEDAPSSEEATPEEPAAAQAPWSPEKPCENYQHPYQADLCQQWRAAEAAERAAAAADRTAAASKRDLALTRLLMLIGLLASGLLLLMFIPIIAAALAARRAARSGGAAHSANEDREGEVRAYVDVDKLEFIETPESEGVVKVKVVFKNTGQTPAFQTRSTTKIDIRDGGSEDEVPVMPLPDRALNAARPRLGSGATAVDVVECDSTPSLPDRVMNGKAMIVVWGWTEYTDVFGRKRRTPFQYLCNEETLESGQIFKPMNRGDEGS